MGKIAADRNDLRPWFGDLAALATFAAIAPASVSEVSKSAGAPLSSTFTVAVRVTGITPIAILLRLRA